jgi:hypothetical protein
MHNQKFIPDFIEFVRDNFDFEGHFFLIVSGLSQDSVKIPEYENVLYLEDSYNKNFFRYNNYELYDIYLKYTQISDKILLHSMKDRHVEFLFLNQHLLEKSYWATWGYDIYFYQNSRNTLEDELRYQIRKEIYAKIKYLVVGMKYEKELVEKVYGTQAKWIDCFMYPSNLYKEPPKIDRDDKHINILIGNSADPSNNHLDIFSKIEKYKDKSVRVFVPLSYGNEEYAQQVIDDGVRVFGDRFVAMREFMPLDKYIEFLMSIDIAIFGHERQQAMGNIITLLGFGKKVYIKSSITTWEELKYLGVEVFDYECIESSDILDKAKEDIENNINVIKERYSKENLRAFLNEIFEE